MKKDFPSIGAGIVLGLLIAWLAGLFAAPSTPAPAPSAATAPAPAASKPIVLAPASVKPAAPPVVAPPTAAPAPVTPAAPSTSGSPSAAQQAQFDQVRQQSRIKAITNNLRQLSTAAQQYMLDKGVTAAGYYDLVGTDTDNYIRNVSPVMGEDYTSIYITQQDTQIMIVTPDGTMVTYNM